MKPVMPPFTWLDDVDVVERTDKEVWDEWDRLTTVPGSLDPMQSVRVKGEDEEPCK